MTWSVEIFLLSTMRRSSGAKFSSGRGSLQVTLGKRLVEEKQESQGRQSSGDSLCVLQSSAFPGDAAALGLAESWANESGEPVLRN